MTQFSSTTIYYWPLFNLNATSKSGFKIVSGPFQFGNADQLNRTSHQCLGDNHYINNGDTCFGGFSNCSKGFSFSFFFQTNDITDSGTPGVREYLISTGGDQGTPGFAVFFNGVNIGATVCVRNLTWSVSVVGQRPATFNWYNFGVRWILPTYKNSTDFARQKMNNVPTKDFGGLELFINMKSVAYVLLPDEIGCATSGPNVPCNVSTGGLPLNPPEVLIGCHKTQANQTKRLFASGTFDEIAFWPYRLNDTELPYFLGGYKSSLENISINALLQVLQNVNMSDPGQANTAISVVQTIVLGTPASNIPTGNIYQTTTVPPIVDSISSTTTATTRFSTSSTSTSTTASTTTPDPSVVIRQLIRVMNTLTNVASVPQNLDPNIFELLFNAAVPVGSILSIKGKYHDGWESLNQDPSEVGGHLNRETLNTYLMTLLRNKGPDYYGQTSYVGIRVSDNYAVQLNRLTAQEFSGLATDGSTYFALPNWQDGNWTNYLSNIQGGPLPIDAIHISTNIFSGSCKTQNVLMMASIFDTFPDPGRKNPVTIPASSIVLDSRIMTIQIESSPLSGSSLPCQPDPKLLLSYPMMLTFEMTSSFKTSSVVSRGLKFHDENPNNTIYKRYCAVWNPDLFGVGGWDTTGVKSIYSDNTVTNCYSVQLGSFAVIAQMDDTPYVPKDPGWLMATKLAGYVLSLLTLALFIIAVCSTASLWEMFHIIGMNLSAAQFLGNLSMILAEFTAIRSDRHLCAGFGICIDFFYTSAAMFLMLEAHAVFRATTSGIIGGKTKSYVFLGWGLPTILIGVNIYLQLIDMGDDPRCMVGWSSSVKWFFFIPILCAGGHSLLTILVILCNLGTPALRKRSLIADHSSLAKGLAVLVFLFCLCWAFAPVAYMNLSGDDTPSFYPAFQLLNSFMGVFVFVCIGIGSKKFRKVLRQKIKKQ